MDALTESGGALVNSGFDSSMLQIQYAGTGTVKVSGGVSTAAMIYAPNAGVQLTGGSDFYGSILSKTLDDSGGTDIHYDKSLSSKFSTAGNYMLSSFTWKKY